MVYLPGKGQGRMGAILTCLEKQGARGAFIQRCFKNKQKELTGLIVTIYNPTREQMAGSTAYKRKVLDQLKSLFSFAYNFGKIYAKNTLNTTNKPD